MNFELGEVVRFKGSEATIARLDGTGNFTIKQNDDYVTNVPLHMLTKIGPPPASVDEAVLMTLKNIDKSLVDISTKLTMLLMRP